MPELPTELLILPPLAVASGIDLYLTLLLLGAAPTTPWWNYPLPGALGDLDSPGVLIVVGTFYLLEFSAERYAPAALAWNAFHAVIRPVAGALLALLLLDGAALPVLLGGMLAAGALASLSHTVRTGGMLLRWLGSTPSPNALLVSLLEDAVVIGLVVLALDAPERALGVAGALTLLAAVMLPSRARALAFGVRLGLARVFEALTQRRWREPDDLPPWLRRALTDEVLAPDGGLRGSPAAAYRVPGGPRFATGWIVIHGSRRILVFPKGIVPGRPTRAGPAVDLGPLSTERVLGTGLFRRVDLRTDRGKPASLIFDANGPSLGSLEAEFLPR